MRISPVFLDPDASLFADTAAADQRDPYDLPRSAGAGDPPHEETQGELADGRAQSSNDAPDRTEHRDRRPEDTCCR